MTLSRNIAGVNPPSHNIARQSQTGADQNMTLALRMLEELHAGGAYYLYSRPQGNGYESDWRKAGKHAPPRTAWLENDHVFFGVNPHAGIPETNAQGKKQSQKWVRGTAENVAAINALFAEIDAKDMIGEEEWLPFYVAPDVSGMTKTQARGALQKAETAAIDAALVATPESLAKYKRRALRLIERAPMRPSSCWDSGGGYQAVWLLDDTLLLDDHNRADVAHIQKEWVRLIGGDPAASDLNRVLRPPGTVNRKKKYGPNGHAVVFLWCDLDVRYSFAELAKLVPETPAAAPHARRVYVPAGLPATLGEFAAVPQLPRHPALDEYNAQTELHELLLDYGYTDAGGGRMNRPGGDSAGVQLHADNTASIYSSADPLWCGHRITPALARCVFEHDGDAEAMLDALTEGERKHFLAQVDALRLWARTTNFATYAPEHADVLRRTDSADTKVLDALCDLWAEAGCWTTKPVGKKRLGARAGTSPNAAAAALGRLTLFAVDVMLTEHAGWIVTRKTPCSEIDPLYVTTPKKGSISLHGEPHNEYSPRKRHDAYQTGTSRRMREKAIELAPTLEMDPREWLARYAPGLGEKGLRVMDALHRCGSMTAQELADEAGITIFAARSTLRRLHEYSLVDCDDPPPFTPKVWEIVPGAFKKAEDSAYQMRTAGMQDSREERQLEHSQLWAMYEGIRAKTPEEQATAKAKLRWLTKKRAACIKKMRPHWTKEQAQKFAETIPYRQWLQKRAELQLAQQAGTERTDKHHEAMQRMHYAAIVDENTIMVDDLAELRREAWGDKGKPEPAAWNNKIAEMYQGAAA